MTVIEQVHESLSALGLCGLCETVESHLERAGRESPSYADFLLGLLSSECGFRKDRSLEGRRRQSRLPCRKTLAQFDFSFQPSIDKRQVQELQTLRFVHEAENVVFLGPPGVGKTHLSVALAMEAMKAGFSALYSTAADLVTDLGKAAREGKLPQRLKAYLRPKVLVIDETGYLPLDELGATLLFQLVSTRYERGSIVLTSNESFTEWGAIFNDTVLASAILDRLLHHATTVNIRGQSYRLKERKKAGLLSTRALGLEDKKPNNG
jgi:DNA replication protein DnaC